MAKNIRIQEFTLSGISLTSDGKDKKIYDIIVYVDSDFYDVEYTDINNTSEATIKANVMDWFAANEKDLDNHIEDD